MEERGTSSVSSCALEAPQSDGKLSSGLHFILHEESEKVREWADLAWLHRVSYLMSLWL